MIDRVQGYYGFTRVPFGRDLAPSMLHQHSSHREAAARIAWCINNKAIGVVTGEVGAGKTVAFKGAVASLDPARSTAASSWTRWPSTGRSPKHPEAEKPPDAHRSTGANRASNARG